MTDVFVYGLLKPGFSLYPRIEPYVTSSTPAAVRGRLFDVGIPAARFDLDGTIDGFVYRLERERRALRLLDDMEDEGTLYRRIEVAARTDDGVVKAQAYEYLLEIDRAPLVGTSWRRNLPRG